MRKFLVKIILFFVLSLFVLTILLIKYGGRIDPFYEKFTVPKQTSLILGDSRSIQGIQPKIINKELKNMGYDLPMFNYSFTITQIVYGKPYTESITKKLKPSKRGLFIVSVHPWLFTEREGDNLKNDVYSELEKPPHNMHLVNMNPNFEYFLRNYKYFNFQNIFQISGEMHKDGWMEESNLPKDPTDMLWWKNHQKETYGSFAKKWKKSPERLADFINMINYLERNGRVVLVRMPVDGEMLNIENAFWSDFDQKMKTIANQKKLKYFNFSNSNNFKTYDGNHLDKNEGGNFTKILCDSIKMKFD